jgi:hypothetical protein
MGAAVVTPLDLMGRDAGIARFFCFRFCHNDTARKSWADFIEIDSTQVPCPEYFQRLPV